jgi:hypothetical protein
LAADGSKGPRPFAQRRQSTIFLRVPAVDWPAVQRGVKTEFRSQAGRNKTPQLWQVDPPTPVVAWSLVRGTHTAQLMVLEDIWREPLGVISPESLQREGFASLAEFRRYWISREHRHFTPTREVFAYRLRPWLPEDHDVMGSRLLERLYGDFLPAAA